MQNHLGTIDNQAQPKISQWDKLFFCVFLAAAFHALVLFGVGFSIPENTESKYNKTFKVALAQFESEETPEKADFIGQANQQGGGESEQQIAPSATEMALFNDPDQIASKQQLASSMSQQNQPSNEILTSKNDSQFVLTSEITEENNEDLPDAQSLIERSYQSGLIANLENIDINQASKQKKRQISAAIHRSSDALYLDNWRRKIEQIGNLNYPEKAKQQKIYGNLTMKVAINKDGTVNQVAIIKSSGNKVLDDAAIRIVRLAAPFKPLTKEMSQDTDILEIIRVWQFQPDYQLKTR